MISLNFGLESLVWIRVACNVRHVALSRYKQIISAK